MRCIGRGLIHSTVYLRHPELNSRIYLRVQSTYAIYLPRVNPEEPLTFSETSQPRQCMAGRDMPTQPKPSDSRTLAAQPQHCATVAQTWMQKPLTSSRRPVLLLSLEHFPENLFKTALSEGCIVIEQWTDSPRPLLQSTLRDPFSVRNGRQFNQRHGPLGEDPNQQLLYD